MNNEKLLLRYLSALEGGDVETMARLLQLAQHNPTLSRQIRELHEAFEAEVSMNGFHEGEKIMQLSIPLDIRPQTRQRSNSVLLSMIAAVVTLFFVGIVLAVQPISNDSQPATPQFSLNNLQPITPENVDQLTPLISFGRGVEWDIEWSPDGETIAVASASGIYLHNAEALSDEPVLFGGEHVDTRDIVYSANGTKLAGLRENSVYIWDLETGEVLSRIESEEALSEVFISENGGRVGAKACTTYDELFEWQCTGQVIRVWDVEDQNEILNYPIHGDALAAFNPNMTILAYTGTSNVHLHLLDLQTGVDQLVWESTHPRINTMTFNRDGTKLALGLDTLSTTRRVEVNTIEAFLENPIADPQPIDESRLSSPDYGSTETQRVSFRSNDEEIVVVEGDGDYLIWRESPQTAIKSVETSGLGRYWSSLVSMNPDGTRLITSTGGIYELWDIESGGSLATQVLYDPYINQLQFSSNDQILTSSWIGTASLWDLAQDPSTQERITPEVNGLPANSVYATLSPNGNELFYGIQRGRSPMIERFMLRDLITGDEQEIEQGGIILRTAYRAPVVTEEGTLLALTGHGRIARWTSPQQAPKFISLEGVPSSLEGAFSHAISPDGRYVAMYYCEVVDNSNVEDLETSLMRPCKKTVTGLWDTTMGDLVALLEGGEIEFANNYSEMLFSHDSGTLMLTYCSDLQIQVENNSASTFCRANTSYIWDIDALEAADMSPDNAIQPNAILPNMEAYHFITSTHPLRFANVVLVAGRTYLEDVTLRSINLQTGEVEEMVTLDKGTDVAQFSPDGKLFAISNYGVITLYGIPQ
jgi:WD40 repeat protein